MNRYAMLLVPGITLVSIGASQALHDSAAASVKIVDIIPKDWSSESHQDSEPFLSVDPGNPARMVVSAFIKDRRPGKSASAPVIVSLDGGSTWNHSESIPIATMTADITHAFAHEGILQAGALTVTGTAHGLRPDLLRLRAPDSVVLNLMNIQGKRINVDQPFVTTAGTGTRNYVYVGENDLSRAGVGTAAVEVSDNGGKRFNQTVVEPRPVDGQDGPSIRLAVANDGKVYAAYFGWREYKKVDDDEGWVRSDVVVARDDGGKNDTSPFSDLKDQIDHMPGSIVARSVRIHWSNKETLGKERTGSTLSLAVDRNDSSKVYVAWADNADPENRYTVHVWRSTNRGSDWEHTADYPNSTCVALAVADNGTLGVLYQQLTGNSSAARWETHLVQTADDFRTKPYDIKLADVPANLPSQFFPYLGDYNFLLTVGREFRGVFAANNYPDRNNFFRGAITYLREVDWNKHVLGNGHGARVDPSIDPFYFGVPVADNPRRLWAATASTVAKASKAGAHAVKKAVAMAAQPSASQEEDLGKRVKAADVVVAGTVVKVREAGGTFAMSGGRLQAVPSPPRTGISEHSPHWKEAVIRVERGLHGLATSQHEVVVQFPASRDVLWYEYPKLEEGEHKVFVLKKSRTAGGALQSLGDGTPLFAPPAPGDVLPADQVENVKQLLRQ
jgi:hypothetical protein